MTEYKRSMIEEYNELYGHQFDFMVDQLCFADQHQNNHHGTPPMRMHKNLQKNHTSAVYPLTF